MRSMKKDIIRAVIHVVEFLNESQPLQTLAKHVKLNLFLKNPLKNRKIIALDFVPHNLKEKIKLNEHAKNANVFFMFNQI